MPITSLLTSKSRYIGRGEPSEAGAALDSAPAELGLSRYFEVPVHNSEPLLIHVVEYLAAVKNSPIVLALPFTAGHARNLRPVCELLAQSGIHAIAFDYPGHGRSAGDRGVIHIENLFQTIRHVMEEYANRFPGQPVHVTGSSWGGDLAILYSMWEHELFDRESRLPLVSSVIGQAVITPWQREVFCKFRRGVSLLFSGNGIFRDFLRMAVGPRMPVTSMYRIKDMYRDPVLRKQFATDPLILRSYETTEYFNYLAHQPNVNLSDIATPIHLVIGAKDAVVPLKYERMVFSAMIEKQMNVSLTVLNDAGHGAFEEEPAQIAAVVQHAVRERIIG